MFELVRWPDLPDSGEFVYQIRMLSIRDRCTALDSLIEMRIRHTVDYKKLLNSARYVLTRPDSEDGIHVRASRRHRGVFELKGGQIRLFYFVSAEGDVAVCTNVYWKAKSSRNEQNAAFEKCARLRMDYLNWWEEKVR